jgi:hypothetical protein
MEAAMARVWWIVCVALIAAACAGNPARPTDADAFFTVAGRVTDSAQKPLAGVAIEIEDGSVDGRRVFTDDDGRFQLFNVRSGLRRITVSKEGYVATVTTVLVDRDIDVLSSLEPAAER